MNTRTFVTIGLLASALVWSSCSSTKDQEAPPPPPPVVTPPPPVVVPERSFAFTERYFVPNAVIAPERDVKDPLQALRVIQLDKGPHQVLVISTFEKTKEGDHEVGVENWLGIEMPRVSPGVYNITDAVKIQFFRFFLGNEGKRFDGFSYDGTLHIESRENGFLTGSVELVITGMIRSFHTAPEEFKTSFSGSFRIREVELENTIMKSR